MHNNFPLIMPAKLELIDEITNFLEDIKYKAE
jgi:hypothetical protein